MSSTMERLERILSRPTAKPYRTRRIHSDSPPFLNEAGHLDFHPDDVENPKNWSARRRWYITVIAVLQVVNATFASSSPSGSIQGIAEHFHVSETASQLVITLFLLGYCFGPFFFAPLSEYFGRRYIFYFSFTAYLIFNFLCAFTPSFAGLLIGRFLTGSFASAPLSNAPGVLADIWGPVERGNAMAVFSMMTFVGPALGPVVSGFLELKKDWRWNFYVLIWFAAITELLIFTIPETYPPIVLYNKARRIRSLKLEGYEDVQSPVEASGKRNLKSIFKVALVRPWQILFDPISFLVAIYVGVVYALLYMLFTIYPIVFQEKRHWNSGVGELPLIGSSLGACVGGAICFAVSQRDKKRLLAGIKSTPEDRLPVAMIGGLAFAVSMFWFAWCGEYNSVPWIVVTIAGVFLSASILLIFVAYLNYLTDTYLMYTASAMAANTVIRSAFGAAAPLYTKAMFDRLGVGGGGSLIGGFAVLLAPIPFVFYKYGASIRVKSRFAPTAPPTAPTAKPDGSAGAPAQENGRSVGDAEKGEAGGLGNGGSGDAATAGTAGLTQSETDTSNASPVKERGEEVDVEKKDDLDGNGLKDDFDAVDAKNAEKKYS